MRINTLKNERFYLRTFVCFHMKRVKKCGHHEWTDITAKI